MRPLTKQYTVVTFADLLREMPANAERSAMIAALNDLPADAKIVETVERAGEQRVVVELTDLSRFEIRPSKLGRLPSRP